MFDRVLDMPLQIQPLRSVLRKRCSENMQEIYRKTPMPKCDFNKVAMVNECSPVNFLHILRTLFLKNTSGRLLLPLDYVAKFQIYEGATLEIRPSSLALVCKTCVLQTLPWSLKVVIYSKFRGCHHQCLKLSKRGSTAQKMKFSIIDFSSKCDQIRKNL